MRSSERPRAQCGRPSWLQQMARQTRRDARRAGRRLEGGLRRDHDHARPGYVHTERGLMFRAYRVGKIHVKDQRSFQSSSEND